MLFNDNHTCDNEGAGPICYNPEQDVPNGPASPFFEPCAGAAYTYPNDNAANSYGQCNTGVIHCCVGPSCPAPARQVCIFWTLLPCSVPDLKPQDKTFKQMPVPTPDTSFMNEGFGPYSSNADAEMYVARQAGAV